MKKLSQYSMDVLLIWGVIAFFLSIFGDNHEPLINSMYVYFSICVIVTLIATVVGMINKPGSLKGAIIGIAGFIFIGIIAYILADDSVYEGQEITASTSKWVGMGLYMFYILLFLSVAVIAYTGIAKYFR